MRLSRSRIRRNLARARYKRADRNDEDVHLHRFHHDIGAHRQGSVQNSARRTRPFRLLQLDDGLLFSGNLESDHRSGADGRKQIFIRFRR